jgi:uncharacterized protein YlxW (UPF0749 family)
LLRLRARPVDLLVAALLAVLGFGIAVQVRSTQGDGLLSSARQQDLVQILDELGNRSERLRGEIATLSETREQLSSGSGSAASALAEARRRTQVLGVVAGTVPATGPGIVVGIGEGSGKVSASLLLDTMEELRNAGAEAMQFEGATPQGTKAVRIVASSWFVDAPDGVLVDGVALAAPFRFLVIGDSSTLAGAMAIPGGVEDTVQQAGGTIQVSRATEVRVTALHVVTAPRYARPE